jgi:hypothetical protein
MFTGGSRSEEIAPQQQAASAMDEKPQQQPCEFEWRQFVEWYKLFILTKLKSEIVNSPFFLQYPGPKGRQPVPGL